MSCRDTYILLLRHGFLLRMVTRVDGCHKSDVNLSTMYFLEGLHHLANWNRDEAVVGVVAMSGMDEL